MSEPLAKDRLKEMIRQLKAWGYDASEIDLEFELAIDTLLLENAKLKAELQRTRDLLGSWINKATKAHKDLEKLKEERDAVASGKITCADCNAVLARW